LVHGGNPAFGLPRWVDIRYLLREWRFGRRAAATYVCCTKYVADSFSRSFYLRRFAREVVYNGIKMPAGSLHIPREIELGRPFTIGMVARLDPIKDHATLLRAFELIASKHPEARLELAGDGDQREHLESLAASLGISKLVTFLGNVRDVYCTMASWDAFAYATTMREGLGNALSEAMIFGLPCVATNVGPIREVAGEPPTISLVPPNNPEALAAEILSLIHDRARRRHLSTAARTRALAHFSPRIFAKRYLNLLGIEQSR